MGEPNLYKEIEIIGRKMVDLGELVITELQGTAKEAFSTAFAQLHHRDSQYSVLQRLTSDAQVKWAHLEGQSDAPDTSDTPLSNSAAASQRAYRVLQEVLEQNSQLESLIQSYHERVVRQIGQVEQQKRLERAYHPNQMAAGIWSQAR